MAANRPKVVVAMSGGVDSSVAACLLHEQGYDVTGLFMRIGIDAAGEDDRSENARGEEDDRPGDGPARAARMDRRHGCCSAADASDARAVAGQLGAPFFAMNFKEQFDRIIEHFADEYQKGRTPNPCVLCNKHLKFGRLWDYAQAAEADFIATGHYARIDQHNNRYRLLRSADQTKDQSYVLFGIGADMLGRTLFPVGDLHKEQVREHAQRFGLNVCDKPESMDICFVPDGDYGRLIRERRPESVREGPIVDATGRQVGLHQGIANFTIGQRRGLGVAMGSPLYVTNINAQTNTVTVGTKQDLASDTLDASGVHWLIDPPSDPLRANVQIRYAHEAAPAIVELTGDDRVRVQFDEPQTAITPGQAAVFYDDDDNDFVLGGGWID